MIIIGFPAIGKSSFQRDQMLDKDWCEHKPLCVDLESSNFNKSNSFWLSEYCKVAMDLERQGFIVLVSSHHQVRQHLLQKKQEGEVKDLYLIYPAIETFDMWETRCKNRYLTTNLEKDRRSLLRVQNFFQTDVMELDKEVESGLYTDFYKINGPYSLGKVITNFLYPKKEEESK